MTPTQQSSLYKVASLGGLLIALLCAVANGSTSYNLMDLFGLMGNWDDWQEGQRLAATILLEIRLPRIAVAAVTGAALASAGVLSQGLFRNSLASPSILGTTTGGSFVAACIFFYGAAYHHWFTLPAGAFMGAAVATGILFVMSKRFFGINVHTLLLAGFALNALLGAMTSLVISLMLEDQQKAAAVMHWLLGGFSARGLEHLLMVGPTTVLGLIMAFFITRKLDVLSLGEEVAQSLSVNLKSLWRQSIVAIALLVGGAVAVAGAIPFVGLVVPHITRLLLGPQHRRLLLFSAINGASLTLIADLAARTLRAPQEFEVGVLISLLGAPFFIWLLLNKKGGRL